MKPLPWYPSPRLGLLVLLLVSSPAVAQLPIKVANRPRKEPPAAAPDGAAEHTSQLLQRRQLVSERLRVAKRILKTAQDQAAEPPEQLSQEVELLKQIDTVLAQLESATSSRQELQTRLDSLRSSDAGATAPATAPTFIELDKMRDELASKTGRSELVEAAVKAAADAVETTRASCDERERALRLLKESKPEPDETAREEIKRAELKAKLCKETFELRKQQLASETLKAEVHKAETELLSQRIEQWQAEVRFVDQDLQDKLVELDKQEADLERSLATLKSDEAYVERQLFDARQQLEAAEQETPALKEQVESRRLLRQLLQQQIETHNLRLQQLSSDRGTWKRRLAVANEKASTEELIQWKQEADATLSQLDRERRIHQQRIDELRSEIATRDAKLSGDGLSDPARRWVQEQQSTLQRVIQVYDRVLVDLAASRRLHAKLLSEIEGDASQWTLTSWLSTAGHYFRQFWNAELAQIDERPITAGKVILGVLLLFCGMIMARMLSRAMGNRLLSRFGMDEGGVSALQSVAFYSMLVVFTLMSLRFINIPLTVFTLLGGAIAIGVGFGSQNIINNFISGLILLAERPIKVGDLIQLEGLYGNVVKIGARSTQIRTGENLDIIVPNSKFLENNVINLTLNNDKLRTKVSVGVTYGSPTREVTRLLEHAAAEHGRILRQPAPFVWFVDFGDNSLCFQLHFWVQARTVAERTRIESDIRHQIDHLFREAGIVIAFPQRDVHLDSTSPIAIRLLPDGEDSLGRDAA